MYGKFTIIFCPVSTMCIHGYWSKFGCWSFQRVIYKHYIAVLYFYLQDIVVILPIYQIFFLYKVGYFFSISWFYNIIISKLYKVHIMSISSIFDLYQTYMRNYIALYNFSELNFNFPYIQDIENVQRKKNLNIFNCFFI